MRQPLDIRLDCAPIALDPLVEVLRELPPEDASLAYVEAASAAYELLSFTTDANPHDQAVRLLEACQGSEKAAAATIGWYGFTPESRELAVLRFRTRLCA